MVTASHNPSKYNGYKVHGPDGCQITTEAAKVILAEIEKVDIFADVKSAAFDEGLSAGKIDYIDASVLTGFIEEFKGQSVLKFITDNGSVVVRPSGTETKLKTYISITAANKE